MAMLEHKNNNNMDEYVNLAKQAIEEFIKNKKVISVPENLPSEFYSRRAGVFVTIRNGKDLRGCIGTFLPTKENIAKELIDNAISACSADFRFNPIIKEELLELSYEVSILSNPEPVKDIKYLHPKKDGVIVKCADGRCGLLLPDIEGVDSTEQQILIACQKGGIEPMTDKFSLYSFTVEKHK
jgi:AmmeMemoRadiSam system protein A